MKDVDIEMALERAESTSRVLKLGLYRNVQDTLSANTMCCVWKWV